MSDILIDRRSLEPPYEAPPDFVCPHCHASWYWDEEENAWMCQTRPAYWSRSSEHPAVGGFCWDCFVESAPVEFLHEFVNSEELYGELLACYVGGAHGRFSSTEDIRDLMDCLYEGYPEAYKDAGVIMVDRSDNHRDYYADHIRAAEAKTKKGAKAS